MVFIIKDRDSEGGHLTCDHCGLDVEGRAALRAHIKQLHSTPDAAAPRSRTRCNWCHKNFSTVYKWRTHVKMKHKQFVHRLPPLKRTKSSDFPCEHCSKTFSTVYKLRTHVSERHSEFMGRLAPLKRSRRRVISCEICEKGFSSVSKLRDHCEAKHADLPPPPRKKAKGPFVCSLCERKFAGKLSLQRHTRSHAPSPSHGPARNLYKCPLCTFSIHGHIKLIYNHFESDHGLTVIVSHLEFDHLETYERWKCDLENKTTSLFIRSNQNKKNEAFYLRCHRSGHFSSRSRGIRRLKCKGSNKINGFCPASIVVKRTGQRIKVRFVETHVGHEQDVKYVPLYKQDRQYYASKIAANISFDEILLEVENNLSERPLERRNLVTKKDLRNIGRSVAADCQLVEGRQHVLFYKPRKLTLPQHTEFIEDDFAAVIMSAAQIDTTVNSSPSCILCLDRTASVAEHHFEIFTLVLVGCASPTDTGTEPLPLSPPLPLAFFVTTESNEKTLRTFFDCVLRAVGERLKPEMLLVDVEGYCYEAWVAVMGEPHAHSYSPWLVARDWLRHLVHVTTKPRAVKAFQCLMPLLWSMDNRETFRELLHSTLNILSGNNNISTFVQYFENSYLNSYDKWASCFRDPGVEFDALFNMERLHNLINSVLPKGQKGSNMVGLVRQVERWIEEDTLCRVHRRGTAEPSTSLFLPHTCTTTTTGSHHRSLKRSSSNCVFRIGNITHLLSLKRNTSDYFCVKRRAETCPCNTYTCACVLCPHSYLCTCVQHTLTDPGACCHVDIVSACDDTPSLTDEMLVHADTVQADTVHADAVHADTVQHDLSTYQYEVVILDADVQSVLDSNTTIEFDIETNANGTESSIEDEAREIILEFDVNSVEDGEMNLVQHQTEDLLLSGAAASD